MILAGLAHARQRTAIAGCSSVTLVLGYDCSEVVFTPAARGQAAPRGRGGTARAQAGPGAPPRRAAPAMAARKRDQVCTSFLAVIPPLTRRTLCQELNSPELIGTKRKLRLYAMPKGSAIYTLCTKPQSNFPNIFLNKLDYKFFP